MADQPRGASEEEQQENGERSSTRGTAISYMRGAAGGLLVGVPLLMTMEMWWQGFVMSPGRMLLFLVFNLGILLILERFSGFRKTFDWVEEIQDAVVALGIGLLTSTGILGILGIIESSMPLHEISGKIIVESFPVSIGASVAVSQLGKSDPQAQRRKRQAGFWGRRGVGLAGAMFFGLNIAVTEEPVMLALQADWWHVLLLLLLSFVLSYVIVYAAEFRGTKTRSQEESWWAFILKETTSTYAMALAVAGYLLWTFGRFDPQTGLSAIVCMVVMLGFVTALGSAAGNLLL